MNRLFELLIAKILFAGTMFFTAAAVALPAAGAGDGADGGGNDPIAEGLPAGDGAAGGDGSGPAAEGTDPIDDEAAGGAPPDPKAGAQDPKIGGALPKNVKTALETLKATDPTAAAWLKDQIFANRDFRQQFPGGMEEVKALKTAAETFKTEFPEGVAGIKAEKAEWAGIDQAWNNADPRVLDTWIEMNRDSFGKLMPTAFGKYADIDPAGYQYHMAGIFTSTLAGMNVTANLHMLTQALEMGNTEYAKKILGAVNTSLEALNTTARTKPAASAKAPDQDARGAELDSREAKIWINETAAPINAAKTLAIKSELKQYLKGTEIDDETYGALEAQTLKYLDELLKQDPNFGPTFNKYIQAHDRAGITRYMQSKISELLPSQGGKPGPVERAYKLFFRGAAPKAAKPAAAAAPGAAPVKAAPGWTRVAQGPEPNEIAPGQHDRIFDHQAAVLRDGRKVYWGKNPPPA